MDLFQAIETRQLGFAKDEFIHFPTERVSCRHCTNELDAEKTAKLEGKVKNSVK